MIKIWLDLLGDATSTHTFPFGIGPKMQLNAWFHTSHDDLWVILLISIWDHPCSIGLKVNWSASSTAVQV